MLSVTPESLVGCELPVVGPSAAVVVVVSTVLGLSIELIVDHVEVGVGRKVGVDSSTNSGAMATGKAPSGGTLPGNITNSCPDGDAENEASPNSNMASLKNHLYLFCSGSCTRVRGRYPIYELVPTNEPVVKSWPSLVSIKTAALLGEGSRYAKSSSKVM